MKKTLAALLLMGAFISATPGLCNGANLIENGDFEKTGPDMTPQGWEYVIGRNTQADISLDENEKTSGTHSLKISLPPPGGQVTLKPQKTAVSSPVPGKTYELTAWIKVENLGYNQIKMPPVIRINFRPTRVWPQPIINIIDKTGENSDWKKLSLQLTAPDDAQEFLFDIMLTRGTMWIDEINLEEINSFP